MNELYSMSVASTMMDHTKANVFENEVAKFEDSFKDYLLL